MRWVLVAFAVTGCNQVFGLEATAKESCAPLTFDPLRYVARAANPTAFNVGSGRTKCQGFAMDLVVFDEGDSDELAHELTGAPVPFWTGVSYFDGEWTTSDGCAPYLGWAAGQPNANPAAECILVNVGGLYSHPCDTVDAAILCETPRPNAACSAQAAQRNYSLGGAADVTFATASSQCGPGSHLVEIDSSDELDMVNAYAGGQNAIPYWIGAQYFTQTWTFPTGCPGVFGWGVGQPYFDPTKTCVQVEATGMYLHNCADTAHAICETNQ